LEYVRNAALDFLTMNPGYVLDAIGILIILVPDFPIPA
jgi:hypothetical protein